MGKKALCKAYGGWKIGFIERSELRYVDIGISGGRAVGMVGSGEFDGGNGKGIVMKGS